MREKCEEGFKNGKLIPIIDKVYDMSKVADAHRYMESNVSIGKIILKYDLWIIVIP